MTKTLRGKVRGKTIELDEDPGIAEGQEVEIEMTFAPPMTPQRNAMSEGLTKIYEILGERYDSGVSDLAERHNEHQP
ncbi:MAG TPA: hypothetical protein VND64_09000 [Pirellulales bacterium]|nr:hypothetical protein [Pirellulales bacterium]